MKRLEHIRRRRAALAQRFNVARQFQQIEETCVPSYLHPNPLAAGVAWWRLFVAVEAYKRIKPEGPVLDFGAATGELGQILGDGVDYEFVEIDETMASALSSMLPGRQRHTLDDLPDNRYGAIFALDSLEHNENIPAIVDRLLTSLRPGGALIVSGPTENFIYRLGRRVAGFSGGYHKATIYDIENVISQRMTRTWHKSVPVGIPLFSISVYQPR